MANRNRQLLGPAVQVTYTAITTSTGFMLVDLSDTTKFDHDATGHIVLDALDVSIESGAAFTGDFIYGFITGAGAASSTLNVIKHIPMNYQRRSIDLHENFHPASLQLKAGRHFGQLKLAQTYFQTDTAIKGPNGQTDCLVGNGDLVLLTLVGASTAVVAQTVIYHTEP